MSCPKVSIICPVYNAEKYIHRCIDSIKAQTLTDWELILVDDGSPDKSGAICDEYAAEDSRIRVIHKENGGVAAARQFGLDASCGDYVIHIDSDDWIDYDMLDELYQVAKMQNLDMLICDYFENDGFSQKYIHQKPTDANSNIFIIKDMFKSLHGSSWNKLIRLSVIKDKNISYYPGIDYCEDLIFNILLLKNNIKVGYHNKAYYHYFQNIESIVHSKSVAFFNMADMAVCKLESILEYSMFSDEINLKKIGLKADAFYCNAMDKQTYERYYVDISPFLIFRKGFNWLAILFFVSCYNYVLAKWIYSAILKARKIVSIFNNKV